MLNQLSLFKNVKALLIVFCLCSFTHLLAVLPMVTQVSPPQGVTAGGTLVSILGSGFTGASAVHFGGTLGVAPIVYSDGLITVTAPAGTGTVHVTVTTMMGTSSPTPGDLYAYSDVQVQSVNPTQGSLTGGTVVNISGLGFTGVSSVVFGTTQATSFVFHSDTSITATSPSESAGTVDVRVTANAVTSPVVSLDQYTYTNVPALSAVMPMMGTEGTPVLIYGASFDAANQVFFGATPATSFMVVNDGEISAVAPAGAGTVNVTVMSPAGTSNSMTFIYTTPLTPSNFVGVIHKAEFINETTYSLTSTWSASSFPDIVLYQIFEGNVLVGEVAANMPLVFETQLKSKSAAKTYQVAAVDSAGAQSDLVPITIIKQ